MCGRVHQTMSPAEIARHFGVEGPLPNAEARPNGSPSQLFQVIRWNKETQKRTMDVLKWGLIPHWVKDPNGGKTKPINAMCETVHEKPMFRGAWKDRRMCILPVTGFFEWKSLAGGKQPFAIAMEDGSPFAIAGLWENWKNPNTGEWVRTFTVITCPANKRVAKIHDRMPVILRGPDYAKWLGQEPATEAELRDMLQPYPPGPMTMWPVTKNMNSPRYQERDVMDRVDIDDDWED